MSGKHGHCNLCRRTYRSAASRKLAESRSAVIASLQSYADEKRSPDKIARKHLASAEYRQTGDIH